MPKSRWTQQRFSIDTEGNNILVRSQGATNLRIRKCFISTAADMTGECVLKIGHYVDADNIENSDDIAGMHLIKAGSQYLLVNMGNEFIEVPQGMDVVMELSDANTTAINLEYMFATQDDF